MNRKLNMKNNINKIPIIITPKYTKLLILKTYRNSNLESDLNFGFCLVFGCLLVFIWNNWFYLNANRILFIN